MVTIYKLIDGVESEVLCTTQDGAEAMVKSNPDKYSFEKRVKEDSPVKNDKVLIKEIEELKAEKAVLEGEIEELKSIIEELQNGTLPAGVSVEADENVKDEPPADGE